MSRIAVTGMGILSAAGPGIGATERALREGRPGLGRLTLFPSPKCGSLPVGQVTDLVAAGPSRTVALARPAIEEALHALPAVAPERTGIVLGTCVGGMPETEHTVAQLLAGEDPVDESVWARHPCGETTRELAARFDLRGPALTISTACSSAAQALATAGELLEAGAADRVVAGGVDALCRLTLNGFASLLAVDPEGCRPFDVARQGMSLGEGAAFVVLEREDDVRSRAGEALSYLAGWGNSCDAHHDTAPEPEGRGAGEAMQGALARAGVAADQVDYVNAHGTGTLDNDRAEGRALSRLFGRDVSVSSTKRCFGHTLGAAGAIEAVVCTLALRRGFLPGNPGLERVDPECEVTPLGTTVEERPRVVLSNSFGFGGNNTVLCFTAAGREQA